MNLGGPELIILLIMGVIPLACAITVLVSALSLPDAAYQQAGVPKVLWIILPIAGVFVCGIAAVVVAIVWFASVRPKVVAARPA